MKKLFLIVLALSILVGCEDLDQTPTEEVETITETSEKEPVSSEFLTEEINREYLENIKSFAFSIGGPGAFEGVYDFTDDGKNVLLDLMQIDSWVEFFPVGWDTNFDRTFKIETNSDLIIYVTLSGLENPTIFMLDQNGEIRYFGVNEEVFRDMQDFEEYYVLEQSDRLFFDIYYYLNGCILSADFENTNEILPNSSVEDYKNYDYATSTFSTNGIAMGTYCYLAYNQLINSSSGVSVEDWDKATLKYFDKTINIDDTSLMKIDEESGKVVSTGWGFSGMFEILIPKSLHVLGDNKYLIEAYKVEHINSSHDFHGFMAEIYNDNVEIVEDYIFKSEISYVFEKKDDYYRLIAEVDNGEPSLPYYFLNGSSYGQTEYLEGILADFNIISQKIDTNLPNDAFFNQYELTVTEKSDFVTMLDIQNWVKTDEIVPEIEWNYVYEFGNNESKVLIADNFLYGETTLFKLITDGKEEYLKAPIDVFNSITEYADDVNFTDNTPKNYVSTTNYEQDLDFLTEKQVKIYAEAVKFYNSVKLGETTGINDVYPNEEQYEHITIEQNGYEYSKVFGEFSKYDDFTKFIYSLFTEDYFAEFNDLGDGTPLFINYEGDLYVINASYGGVYLTRDEKYEITHITDSQISFNLIGEHLAFSNDEYGNWDELDAKLEETFSYTYKKPITLVLTENGWRFDEFSTLNGDAISMYGKFDY